MRNAIDAQIFMGQLLSELNREDEPWVITSSVANICAELDIVRLLDTGIQPAYRVVAAKWSQMDCAIKANLHLSRLIEVDVSKNNEPYADDLVGKIVVLMERIVAEAGISFERLAKEVAGYEKAASEDEDDVSDEDMSSFETPSNTNGEANGKSNGQVDNEDN